MERFRVWRLFAVVVLSCCCLTGCGDATLRDSLTQEQANEIVAALVERGVHGVVERETGGRGKYRVGVKRGNYSEAVSIVHELKLPSEPRTSFAELIAPRGLMPDPREVEALRLDRAIAAEVEEALQSDPSVASVRVVVRLNSVLSANSENSNGTGAAVLLRLRDGSSLNKESLKTILKQTLPGIEESRIVLEVFHEAAKSVVSNGTEGVARIAGGQLRKVPLTEFLWLWRVPEDEYNSLAGWLMLGIIGVFVLGISLGSLLTSARIAAREPSAGVKGSTARALGSRSERSRKELPEAPKDVGGN